MSTWFSEWHLRVVAFLCVASIAVAALAFHFFQNRMALTGGGIAWPKSAWLGLTILFWFVLPALLTSDARLTAAWRLAFAVLLVLMGLRGVVELWMLYVSHNWSPFYGIAHDISCLVALWWFALRAAASASSSSSPLWQPGLQRTALVHALASGLLFIPEIYFAWYMQANFRTQGADPLYFVSDDAAHARVLAVTTAVDAVALLYLPVFLYAWLHGKTEIVRP